MTQLTRNEWISIVVGVAARVVVYKHVQNILVNQVETIIVVLFM